ncbi:5'/3'-nucleotidase SurE [Aeromonas hydrophila]|uniref:5'/3'-nucleotidase SurE n=1 Tax=Aeromonas hydrophila TaxID=644 RepID=UPI000332BC90|nr:5'/3'-nucleotidase SurE [Aeromonas hydrophila]AGM42626.1 5'(3')-nucleotidase/polyphosphatase [Aeromonas hydrophila ML09-119]AHX31347.1 stationary phase survival protein SurE [Aeromonas hydrophila subsp. hydrophila AL09-71]AHX68142.1 stationary phase survival protein SurE [Aeromonas hydrophila pc104A]AJE37807.1 stationary phase survival protein SurE [Aeromonas hydrophila J-1]AKJ36104.1 stationary phase survival protein SurE [Aeromonas hydrophila NJ-35]
MRILVSNDDGVHAEGIRVLSEALAACGEVIVVAPDRNRSGASHSLTLEVPLRVTRIAETGYHAVKGTPTDCVHLAVNELVRPEPDMVVAGINHGANLGDDVIYSGTVAAATEGRHLGFPSLAISLVGKTHFATAAHYAAQLVRGMMVHPLPADQILNVNVPDLPLDQIKGIRVTRLGNRHRAESVICSEDPRGQPIYWIGPPGSQQDAGEGTDFAAIEQGYVSITPLTIDMTAYSSLAGLGAWLDLQG